MRSDSKKIILVNALSVTNQSGLHVLAGHLEQLAAEFNITIIARPSMTQLRERFADRVDWIDAPEKTARWLPRALWEFQGLEKTAKQVQATAYFTPSGIAASRLHIPQVVLCQNPWALVPAARRFRDAPKAWLQRRAYRKTMRRAAAMVFNSDYMRQAYRTNAGFTEKRSIIAYQAADEETRERSKAWKNRPRIPGQILCVSAMAPHKNVEALIRAFEILKCRNTETLKKGERKSENGKSENLKREEFQNFSFSGFQNLSLRLAGSWPDSQYEQKIRKLISELNLEKQIRLAGFVSREELDRLYAESQVFCLMSRCESFGIPAIEAQLFGTPVVCSNVCAVPEICGDGGLFCDPDDIQEIADALQSLLESSNDWKNSTAGVPPASNAWKKYSEQARKNANRFQWVDCSRPLVELFLKLN